MDLCSKYNSSNNVLSFTANLSHWSQISAEKSLSLKKINKWSLFGVLIFPLTENTTWCTAGIQIDFYPDFPPTLMKTTLYSCIIFIHCTKHKQFSCTKISTYYIKHWKIAKVRVIKGGGAQGLSKWQNI